MGKSIELFECSRVQEVHGLKSGLIVHEGQKFMS